MINGLSPTLPVWQRTSVKSAATLACFAISTLGSFILIRSDLALYGRVALTTFSVTCITIPATLRCAPEKMKFLLGIQLAALGALSLGGAAPFLRAFIYLAASEGFKTSALMGWAIVNFVLGHFFPFPLHLLKKGHELISQDFWIQRCTYLKDYYPAQYYGYFLYGLFNFNKNDDFNHPYQGLINTDVSSGLEGIRSTISKIEAVPHAVGHYLVQLHFAIDSLKEEEAEEALILMINKMPQLLSRFSDAEFIDFFKGKFFDPLNRQIDHFLDSLPALQARTLTFEQELHQLEREQPIQIAALQELKKQWTALQIEGGFLKKHNERWKAFFQAWGNQDKLFLEKFSQIDRLIQKIQDPETQAILDQFTEQKDRLAARVEALLQQMPMRPPLKERLAQCIHEAAWALKAVAKKVEKIFIFSLRKGLFILPIAADPVSAAAGFGVGIVYNTLKKHQLGLPRRYEIVVQIAVIFFSLTTFLHYEEQKLFSWDETFQEKFINQKASNKFKDLALEFACSFLMLTYYSQARAFHQGFLLSNEFISPRED